MDGTPEVGMMVCDCRFTHQKIAQIPYPDVDPDYVILENEWACSFYYCCDSADHDISEHPQGVTET